MKYKQHITTTLYNQICSFPLTLVWFNICPYCENWIVVSSNYTSNYKQHMHNVTCLTFHQNLTQTKHHNHTMIKLQASHLHTNI